MNSRIRFPVDLSVLVQVPVLGFAVALLFSLLFPLANWLRNPTPLAWLWITGFAAGTAVLGAVLLFIAKLPQYHAGSFLRIGCRHLPVRERRIYFLAWLLIAPSVVALSLLYFAAQRF